MLDKSFGLLFYLKKKKNYKSGEIPIYVRITVDGAPSELSVKRLCDPERWNSAAGRATGNKESVKALNSYLDTFRNKVFEIKREMIEEFKPMSAEAIKAKLLGTEFKDKMLIHIFKEHNLKIKSLIGIDYALATWKKYDCMQRFTKEFIQWKYNKEDIHIQQLNFEFISELERYFKLVRKCSNNTTHKYIKILCSVISFCIANRWIVHNPFALFKIKIEEVETVFLTQDEIRLIADKDFGNERMNRVRDVYIFCCYTGLSFADVKKLNNTEIRTGVDNELWIFSDRQKTTVTARIPLLPTPLSILKRYENDIVLINKNRVLPVLSNQNYNAYLKEIADVCGINKRLTTHTARHTFATSVTLANGVPIETVSKMLGHKKIQTTQHYAKVLDMKVGEDMEVLRKKFSL